MSTSDVPTMPAPVGSTLRAPEEALWTLRRASNRTILELGWRSEPTFLERRRLRALASQARQQTRDAIAYWHEHLDNDIAKAAVAVALDAERRAQSAYIDG